MSCTKSRSSHEEADTLLILHAVYAHQDSEVIHIMSPDTDVFILALRRQPESGAGLSMIVGTTEGRRVVPLKQIYDAIGPDIANSLPGFHAFT